MKFSIRKLLSILVFSALMVQIIFPVFNITANAEESDNPLLDDIQEESSEAPEEVEENDSPTPTPSPTPTIEINEEEEKVDNSKTEEVKEDIVEEDPNTFFENETLWKRISEDEIELAGKVQLNKTYIFPLNEDVTLKFTQLPINSGKFSIKEITLTEEQKVELDTLQEKVYEIKSDMKNGQFRVDITLPAQGISDFDVMYFESEEELGGEGNIVTQKKIVANDVITIKDVDHFTIFIVVNPNVVGDGNPGTADCSGVGAAGICYDTIQEAIDAAVDGNGDVIEVRDGTYAECLVIDKSDITIQGESQGGTIIDASSCPSYGMTIGSATPRSNITLSDFTLNGPTTVAASTYGIKVENVDGISLTNITAQNSNRSNIDFNGVNNIIINGVTASGAASGNGFAFTDSNNIDIDNITTFGNAWGGVALYTRGAFYPEGTDNVSFGGTINMSETLGIYLQEVTNPGQITNVVVEIGTDFSGSTATYIIAYTNATEDITAVGVNWGEVNNDAVEARILHDCTNSPYTHGTCNAEDNLLPSTVGSVNYLRADLGYGECIDGSRHGASVISFTQGLRKNGTPVNANRSDETRALGEPDGLTAGNAAIIGNFTALGFGGSMTIMFDSPIYEMSSDPADPMDLFIYDVTNNPGAYGLETALIEVSHNGTDWIALGEANSQNNFGGTQGATGLDFDSVGILSFIQYVRITDTSDINNPLFPSDADGFDVDAIGGFCGNVIYGQKFNDINQNGAIDPIDPVIDFWGFFIDENDNQTYDFGEIFTHVDEFTGEYYMANLPGNQTYTICEGPAVEEGWTQSYPTDNNGCHIVEVGDTVDEFYGAYDFANYRNTFGVCTDGNRWAGSVVDFSQGLRKDGTPVLPERSNVISAFGAPDGVSGSTAVNGNFVSLGFGGTVTLRLDEPIYEMTSDPATPMDLFIFESTTNPGAYGEERVSVEVSHDGVTWLTLGEASSLDNFEGNQGESGLDFDSIGLLTSIQYVRLTDISNPASFPDDADGYDVDALGGFCGNVIYGQKFNDLDQNGIIDVTDPVIDFWGFFVDENDNQEYDFGEIFTHVDSETGEYYMANLPGNQTYTICEGQVDGWTQTVPADNNGCYDVTIGDTVDDFYGPYNFANYETENAEIIVYKVEDYRDSTESAQPLATSGTWEFEVRDGSDTLIDTIENYDGSTQSVFDETGSYDSASVIPGTYRISEIAQNDFEFSWGRCLDITNAVPNNGTFMIDISSEADIQHAFGPDASGLTPRGDVVGTWDTTDNEFAEVELSQGQRIYCVFYNAPIGSISGLKWSDENANGVNDAEPGLEGWTIFLDENGNGILDNGEESTLTDVDGNYTFDSVRYGDYVVCEVLQNGWAQTYPGTPSDPECHDVVVDDGTPNLVNIDFGNTELSFVQGIKFRDFNGNGVFNILEILNPANYLNDWTINLYDSSWNLIKTMETGDSSTEAGFVLPSQYRFINLTAGTYHICEELVDGWAQTLPSSGPIDPVNNNSFCRTITLTAGDFELFEWFGNYELGEIRGFKWNDLNTNGSVNGGEPRLEGWTIFIDENGNEVLDNGEVSTTTDISGNYVLDNLEIGSYIICEVLINDWAQTFPGDQSDPDCHTRSINFSGQVRNNVNFGNTELGSIAGRKFEDINGNGVLEVNSPDTRENGWSVYLYDSSWNLVDSMVTGSDNSNTNPIHASGNVAAGQYRFNNLVSGTYYVCEEDRDGWVQTGITPDADAVVLVDGSVTEDVAEDCAQVDVAVNEDRGGIRFLNFELVTILVEKDVIDEDSQDVFDSQIFDIALVEDIAGTIGNGQISDDEVSPINSVFEVGPGVYSIDETEIIGYDLISCLDELDRDSFDVVSGEEIVVVCINEQDPAELNGLIQIAKSNETLDAAGNPSETRQPGDIVEFTIEVTLEEDFPELVITDLLSDSFDFNGTYTVFINGSPVAITPTGYTSPGFWEFGGLVDNDVITIVYQAVVQNDTEDGLYKDVAFAEGFNISNVFAQSTGQAGTILTNQFVGTAVQIAAPTDNNAPGVVLGSSTEFLPSTGANTLWLILTMIILMSGIGFTTYAIFSSKETKFEGFKLSFKLPIVLGVAVLSGFVFSFNNKALAAEEDLVLSVEDPDPANQVGIEIDYVALDLQGDAVTTSCTVQRPSGGAFVAMSTTNPSNAGACIADAGILTEQGLYTVRVTATSVNDSDVVDVILLYDSINPSNVTNYSNSFSEGGVCTHTINFTSGAGSTGYQIFRSSATNFSPNSLVDQASTSGGANESFVDNVPCGQDFYYAVRTFDLAGNTSEFATDTVINVVIVPAVPAPVTNPNQVGGIGTDGGDVLGEGTDGNGATDDGQSGDNNDEDGDVLGEGDESEDGDDASSDDDTDQEGDEDSTNSESEEDSGTNWVIIAALILLIMAGLTGGYLFLTRKKSA